MDDAQIFFLNWVTTYYNVRTNLLGEDRAEALKYMDDDAAFDDWMRRYERKRQQQEQKVSTGGRQGGSRKRVPVGKEQFLSLTQAEYPGPGQVDG